MIKRILNKLFNNPKNIISFKQGFDLTELPCITLYQGENKFNFLLDTGSTDSIINKSILNKIHSEPCETKSNLFGMEGIKKEVSSCTITLEYENQSYKFDYLISDLSDAFGHIKEDTGVTLHGIIGAKFFNKFKYVLDFDKLIAYSKQ